MTAAAGVAAVFVPAGRTPTAAFTETALTVFLSWALIRELDPARPTVALVGAFVSGAVALAGGRTDLTAMAALMVGARILTRSTGRQALPTDILIVGVFVGIFARTPLAWAAGLGLATAIALDTRLSHPAPRRRLWLAGAIAAAVTIAVVASGALTGTWKVPGLTIGVGVLVAVLVWTARVVGSPDDLRRPLDPDRVGAARRLTVLAAGLGTLAGGAAHALETWPAWLSLAAVGLRTGRS